MEATSMGDAFLKNPDLQRILDTEVPLNLFFSLIAGLRIPDCQSQFRISHFRRVDGRGLLDCWLVQSLRMVACFSM